METDVNKATLSNDVKEFIDDLQSIDFKNTIDIDEDIYGTLKAGLNNRSKEYDKILEHYEKYIGKTLESKISHKQCILELCVVVMFLTVIFTFAILAVDDSTSLVEKASIVVPSITAFVTVFMVIPKLITEYLFNKDEEKYMTTLLSDLLKHDISLKTSMDNTTAKLSEDS